MAKKKRPHETPSEPPQGSRRRKPQARRKPGAGPSPSERAMMEAMIRHILAGDADGGLAEGSPAARAEEALSRAFEADDPEQIRRHAREALAIWPDCSDAYVLLAEEAGSPKESMELYAEAIAAAERTLGTNAFEEDAGVFWLKPETRPYMRARYGYARLLWVLGRREEAVAHYQELIRLNPSDNQGVRYILAAGLIELGRDEDLARLLSGYQEDASASWAYSAALLAYRREGDSTHARTMLKSARKCNKYVPEYLTGREVIPAQLPDSINLGSRDEAVDYAVHFLNGWRATPGAISWLRLASRRSRSARAKEKEKRTRSKAKGPIPSVLKRLSDLDLRYDDVWQVETRKLPVWLMSNDEPCRPWLVLVVSMTDDLILNQVIHDQPPSSDFLFDQIAAAMERPAAGEPHLPAEIQHRPDPVWDPLELPLDHLMVSEQTAPTLELADEIIEKMIADVFGESVAPGLLDMPGVRLVDVESFFKASTEFYRAAPWQRVGGTETIKVTCDRFESGPWYAVVIGQMGMTLGLALYENLETLVRMRSRGSSDEQSARETVALSVTFGDKTEIPVADLDAIEAHGWEIPAEDGYARPVRKERGLVMRPPLSWELKLLNACLQLVPRFVAEHDRGDFSEKKLTARVGTGELTLGLTWVER